MTRSRTAALAAFAATAALLAACAPAPRIDPTASPGPVSPTEAPPSSASGAPPVSASPDAQTAPPSSSPIPEPSAFPTPVWTVLSQPSSAASAPGLADEEPVPGKLMRYTVRSAGQVQADLAEFAAAVSAVLRDSRGWSRDGWGFQRVSSGADFEVVLAEPGTVPSFDEVCSADYSCQAGDFVVVNDVRWRTASPAWLEAGASLADYRTMVVNHEVGHWLGRHDTTCPGEGKRSPVMVQQSKGLGGCLPNSWPLASELRGEPVR